MQKLSPKNQTSEKQSIAQSKEIYQKERYIGKVIFKLSESINRKRKKKAKLKLFSSKYL